MRKKSTYEELYALQVLHQLLGFNLENWKPADKPDLQNQIGGLKSFVTFIRRKQSQKDT